VPHIIVKLWPGPSDVQKTALSEAILKDVTAILGVNEASVSVGFEEVPAARWDAHVFEPDILQKWNSLTKQPGYGRRPAGP